MVGMDWEVMTKTCMWQQGHAGRALVNYLILVLFSFHKISTHSKLFSPILIEYFKKSRAKIQK